MGALKLNCGSIHPTILNPRPQIVAWCRSDAHTWIANFHVVFGLGGNVSSKLLLYCHTHGHWAVCFCGSHDHSSQSGMSQICAMDRHFCSVFYSPFCHFSCKADCMEGGLMFKLKCFMFNNCQPCYIIYVVVL